MYASGIPYTNSEWGPRTEICFPDFEMMGTLTRVLPPTGALCFDRAVRMATWARCRVITGLG